MIVNAGACGRRQAGLTRGRPEPRAVQPRMHVVPVVPLHHRVTPDAPAGPARRHDREDFFYEEEFACYTHANPSP